MGTCHSFPIFTENEYVTTKCCLCMKNIIGDYVKCTKCNILLHNKCIKKYKSYNKNYFINCPNCQENNTYHYYYTSK